MSRCLRAAAAPGSHGSGIAGTVAPSDRLSADLVWTASRSLELGVGVGNWCLDQLKKNKHVFFKASRATSSSFQHLQHFRQSFHGHSHGHSTSLHPNQILLCKGQLETGPQLQGCHISSWSPILPMPQSWASWGWEAAAASPCKTHKAATSRDVANTAMPPLACLAMPCPTVSQLSHRGEKFG